MDGSTYWGKLVGFFEGDNAKLKVAVLQLVGLLLATEDRGVQSRVVECLKRNEFVPALCELEVSCEEVEFFAVESFLQNLTLIQGRRYR